MIGSLLNIAIFILVIVGGIVQFLLGKRDNRLGVIIPGILFTFSLIFIFGYVYQDITLYSQDNIGVIRTYTYDMNDVVERFQFSRYYSYLIICFLSNILTMTYLAIFLISRKKHKVL